MDRRRKESAFILKCKKKQILRYSTPATAKTAVAGDPGTLRMTLMKCSKLREVFWGELVS
jgi:hypothetical protein